MAKNNYDFTPEEIKHYSECSAEEWKKIRPQVVAKPPLSLEDRTQVLLDTHRILNSIGLNFWLTNGTLLGFIRDNDFIPWDDDIDLDTMMEDFVPKMQEVKQKFLEDGFIVRMTSTGEYPKVSFFKLGMKVALGPLKDEGKYRTRIAHLYPADCYKNLEYREFKGAKFLVPSPPEKFLETVYKDWKTPTRSNVDEEYHNRNFFRDRPRPKWMKAGIQVIRKILAVN